MLTDLKHYFADRLSNKFISKQ